MNIDQLKAQFSDETIYHKFFEAGVGQRDEFALIVF